MKELFTRWGRNLDSEHVLKEYPRPIMMRETHYEILNGWWEYAFTQNQKKPKQYDGKILVPFSPESVLSGVSRQLMPNEYLWYRTKIKCQEWDNKALQERLLLHFGAVDQSCKIWMNGHFVVSHVGGYLPFSCDISEYVHSGENELVIMVQDLSDTSHHAKGKQKLKRGGMYYTAQSGIWQTVWMEYVPQDRIKNVETKYIKTEKQKEKSTLNNCVNASEKVKIYIQTVSEQKDLTVQIDIRLPKIYANAEDNVTDFIALSHTIPVVQKSISGRANTWIEVEIQNAKYWSCETPYLYYFHVSLIECEDETDKMHVLDEVESYFAIRDFTIQQDEDHIPRIYLNNKKCFLKGVLDQGYWPDGLYTAPSEEAWIFDILEMKKIGFNMVRKHIKIEPQRWYYHCDRLGVIVWQDMVNGGEKYQSWFVTYLATVLSGLGITVKDHYSRLFARRSQKGRIEFINEVKETIQLLKKHPSICTWVIFNEGWGQFATQRITDMVRKIDSEHLIDSASGWFDQGTGDFQSIHNYFFPLKVKPEDVRAAVLSEYGGFTLEVEEHTASEKKYGYGGYKTKTEYQKAYRQLDRKIKKLEGQGLCGCVYTQWSDIEDEINGVYTYDREVNKLS